MSQKWVYRFTELNEIEKYVGGSWDDVRGLLGGKGANLAEMVRIGVPVPDGFIITTEACNEYLSLGEQLPDGLWEELTTSLNEIEAVAIVIFLDDCDIYSRRLNSNQCMI